jgi:hypothetical protein
LAISSHPLPDDLDTLKAMLRAENDHCGTARHRFDPRAATLPEDQMLLVLDDVEQAEAGRARWLIARGRRSPAHWRLISGERCRRTCRDRR